MSKYDPLWAYVKERDEYLLELTFGENNYNQVYFRAGKIQFRDH